MLRVAVPLAAVCAVALPTAAASAADPTPDGPATLMNGYSGAQTAEGRPPEVLVAWRADVSAGGLAGTVRVRAQMGVGGTAVVGAPVLLPAEPGSYTFPAPHLRWDYRGGRLGLEQTTGGHQIVNRRPCQPEYGQYGDPCQVYRVDVLDPPGESWAGAQLALTGITEEDVDRDFRGDATEDRTDLRMTATSKRDADGRVLTAVTVTNAGPLAADAPRLKAEHSGGVTAHWAAECRTYASWTALLPGDCEIAPLAVGASRTVTLSAEAPAGGVLRLSVSAEGEDLAAGDNATTVDTAAVGPYVREPAPARRALSKPFAISAARTQRLQRGIRVKLRAARATRVRVVAAFRVRGRTIRLARTVALAAARPSTVTLRARGADLRALRTALPLRAEITVAPLGGKVAARTTVRVR